MAAFLTSVRYNAWILPALLAIPAAGALLVLALGRGDEVAARRSARAVALVVFLIEFVVSAGLWWSYDPAVAGWQAVVRTSWIPSWGTQFYVGVDGISLMTVLLTTLTMPLAVLGSWTSIRVRAPAYYALLLVLTTGLVGVFVALDLFLFYVMWEIVLVPMYFIIGVWGGERRIYASIKFFIYTMVGSLLMLVGIVYLGIKAGQATGGMNFAYDDVLNTVRVGGQAALWLFGAFTLR